MSVTLQPLHCGYLTGSHQRFESDAPPDPITLPIPAWLIHHSKGLVLVDTGMNPELSRPSKYLDMIERWGFEVGLEPDQVIDQRLAAVDVDAADIAVVILTHLHFDHSGGLCQLPNARVIVQEAEWAVTASEASARASGLITRDFQLGHDVKTVDGAHDVFADGTITCIPTPGHTPGHQSVRVRLDSEEIVLCGDCAYFSSTLAGGALPQSGHDLEQQAASVARLRKLGAQGARLIPGHDADVFNALPTRMT